MKHEHFIIHTIHDNSKNTKLEVEKLVKYLNDGCEIMQHFAFEDEQYFILFNPLHESEDKKVN